MLAKEKWQIRTLQVLELVFEERKFQMDKHGDAMLHLSDGTGREVEWLRPLSDAPAAAVEAGFRMDYESRRGAENPDGQYGQLTRMHLVREELAEAFELEGDDPEFIKEILQVAALCVQWAEYKLELKDQMEALIQEQKCCCQMGGAVGKRHGIPSLEGPEFDCADCPMHGGQQTKYRCKRHRLSS